MNGVVRLRGNSRECSSSSERPLAISRPSRLLPARVCSELASEYSFAFIPCSAANTEVMEMDEEKLIYLVQMYDCLYNIKSRHYSDKNIKNNAWQKEERPVNSSRAGSKRRAESRDFASIPANSRAVAGIRARSVLSGSLRFAALRRAFGVN
ncbi:unnamed protein product [Spodoptera exigua]|nr:unnamed protein product [Spodoptera exigua]